MSQLDDIFKEMAAQAKTAKPLVSEENRSSGLLVVRASKETRTTFDVEQFGQSFTGFISTPSIRLTQMKATWQPMGADGKVATEENPMTRADLIVRFTLKTSKEQVGRILADGSDELLPAYVLEDEALNVWRNRVHTIEGRIWGATPEVISKMTVDLCKLHHFTIQKNVPPKGENADERRPTLFICNTPTPVDVHGEPIWEKRGAPVTSFSIGLPPAPRSGAQANVGLYNDTDRNAKFLNLWCGTLQTTKAMLEASSGNNEEEKRRMRGVMYSLTGYRAWTGTDGPVYNAKEAPLNAVAIGKADFVPPKSSDSAYSLRGSSEDQGMTVDEMLAARDELFAKAGLVAAPAGSENRFDEEDD